MLGASSGMSPKDCPPCSCQWCLSRRGDPPGRCEWCRCRCSSEALLAALRAAVASKELRCMGANWALLAREL